MSELMTVPPGEARGSRRILFKWARSQYGGVVPGIFQILAVDMVMASLAGALYKYLHLRRSSPLTRLQREMLATVVNGKVGGAPWLGLHTAAVRRLAKDEHLGPEFATEWPEYDLDPRTRALLRYASRLTEMPSMVDESALTGLRKAGWTDKAVWEITALAAFFNFTGRLEAASSLPPDEIPAGAKLAEAREG